MWEMEVLDGMNRLGIWVMVCYSPVNSMWSSLCSQVCRVKSIYCSGSSPKRIRSPQHPPTLGTRNKGAFEGPYLYLHGALAILKGSEDVVHECSRKIELQNDSLKLHAFWWVLLLESYTKAQLGLGDIPVPSRPYVFQYDVDRCAV